MITNDVSMQEIDTKYQTHTAADRNSIFFIPYSSSVCALIAYLHTSKWYLHSCQAVNRTIHCDTLQMWLMPCLV